MARVLAGVGPDGVLPEDLIEFTMRAYPDTTERHIRRHLTRMKTGPYRDRITLGEDGYLRYAGRLPRSWGAGQGQAQA